MREIIPLLFIVISVVIGYYYLPQLPDRMAIHFNAQGEPDNWMGKHPAIWILPISCLFFYAGFTWWQCYTPGVFVWKSLLIFFMTSVQLSTIFYSLGKVKSSLILALPSIILIILYGLFALRKSFM